MPRCTKDLIEEKLFARRQDLFSQLDIVFFDTTSLYFEGHGGETLGQYGHSKDHRPDERQMIVGVVLDGEGRPISCELWPGNTADVTTLLPVVDRLRQRFHIRKACIVADRGMICRETVDELDESGRPYILGARMRIQKEVREQVLADSGRFRVVHEAPQKSTDPAPLKVKEVLVEGRRYIVCVNPEQVVADKVRREQIVAGLREQLKLGDKSLVGNKGYRQYLKVEGAGHFVVDEAKLEEEARYDGTWVLRANHIDLSAAEVALQYKKLWMVENWFRDCKTLLETRPIYHRRDETIRGHVFCSFLALVLRQELQARLAAPRPSIRVGRCDARPGAGAICRSGPGKQELLAAQRIARNGGPGVSECGRRGAADGARSGVKTERRAGVYGQTDPVVPRRFCEIIKH